MSRVPAAAAQAGLIAVLVSYLPALSVYAADIVVNNGETNTTAQTRKNQDTPTIHDGGTLNVALTAITLSGASASPGIVIDNAGTISSQTGHAIEERCRPDDPWHGWLAACARRCQHRSDAHLLRWHTVPIDGVPIARDTLMLGAGFDVNVSADLSIGVSYSGEIAGDVQDHGVKGNLSWKF
ncbi:MAG TPA: hypothetical protein PKE16_08390 [Hyphomicrobium sp.]|nr:hypothetical protein [Hyphomicrobium sp.]